MRFQPAVVAVLMGCLLLVLAACATDPPAAEPVSTAPTESPWQPGTPEPLFAPLTGECPAAGDFPPRLDGLRYGINVFTFATDAERVLTLTRIGGFTWVRQQIHWRDLEGTQGQYIWKPLDQIVSAARAHDLNIMLSVVRSPAWATADGGSGLPADPQTFATFLHQVATRYRGRVAAYQVWNEPNLAHENGGTPAQPADYLALLQAAYPAIKQADPCALVVSAALASTNNPDPAVASDDLPFFEALYTLDNGAFLRSADVVALHPGAGEHSPAAQWQSPDLSHHYFRHIERVRDLMLRYADPRQVWISEYGWTVTAAEGAPPPVSEEQQASYLVDALWQTRQRYPWVSAIFVWNLNFSVIAPPDDEKTTFSILNPDWSIRPAFLALQHDVHSLRDAERPLFVPEHATHSHAWTFPGRGAMGSPLLLSADGSTLYVVSDPGTLYAISPEGRLRWHFDAAGAISAAPTLAPDGVLYLGHSGSLLVAVQPDGSVAWRVRLPSPPRGSPVFLGDRVIATTDKGHILAFDTAGQPLWSHDLGSETTPPVATSASTLLLVDATGTAITFDRDGQVVWQNRLPGEFWAAPVADGAGGAYVVTVAGRVLALDSSGHLRWQNDLGVPVVAPPLVGNAAADGQLYIAARDGTLSALAAADGHTRWRYAVSRELLAPPAQAQDGTLYLGDADELLKVLRPDGTIRWQVQVRGGVHAAPLVQADGTLYVPTAGGRVYALTRR